MHILLKIDGIVISLCVRGVRESGMGGFTSNQTLLFEIIMQMEFVQHSKVCCIDEKFAWFFLLLTGDVRLLLRYNRKPHWWQSGNVEVNRVKRMSFRNEVVKQKFAHKYLQYVKDLHYLEPSSPFLQNFYLTLYLLRWNETVNANLQWDFYQILAVKFSGNGW